MNAGLIVGYVYDRSGDPVEEAGVWLLEMRGMGRINITAENMSDRGSPMAETDEDGKFELAFAWSGADIGQVMGVNAQPYLSLVAFKDVRYGRGGTQYESRSLIRGYMVKDIGKVAGLMQSSLTPSSLQSFPGLLSFTKELIEASRKIRSIPAFVNVDLLTTESWLILAAANFTLNM